MTKREIIIIVFGRNCGKSWIQEMQMKHPLVYETPWQVGYKRPDAPCPFEPETSVRAIEWRLGRTARKGDDFVDEVLAPINSFKKGEKE